MDDEWAALSARYPAVVLAGRTRPVAVTPFTASPDDVLDVVSEAPELDPALLRGGAGHLAALREAHPAMHDGEVLAWLWTEVSAGAGRLVVAPGGYFGMVATCDALRAELVAAGPGSLGLTAALPLRDRVHRLGDPLHGGEGRVAAVGLSVLVTVPTPGEPGARAVVLGRRSAHNALDVGSWHVAPSGMVEPLPASAGQGPGGPLTHTLVTELAEELGVVLTTGEANLRARVIGVVHDLLRLRPDVVVRLDLDAEEAAGLRHGPEFSELGYVPLEAVAGGGLPDPLTPAAAGALTLLARRPA